MWFQYFFLNRFFALNKKSLNNYLLNKCKNENKCFVCISIHFYLRLLLYKLLWDVLKCTLRFFPFSPKNEFFGIDKKIKICFVFEKEETFFYFWSEPKKAIRYWVKRRRNHFSSCHTFLTLSVSLSLYFLTVCFSFTTWLDFSLFLSSFLFFLFVAHVLKTLPMRRRAFVERLIHYF